MNVSVSVFILCGVVAAQPLVAQALKVNGAPLTKNQARLIQYIAKDILSNLPRKAAEQMETAAYSAWWALREGTLEMRNPHAMSHCTVAEVKDGKKRNHDVQLGVLNSCERGQPWQVGLAAVQVFTPDGPAREQYRRVQRIIREAWGGTGRDETAIVKEAAKLAGVDAQADAIVALPIGPLRTGWLVRHSVVGIALVAGQEVKPECFRDQKDWCFGGTDRGKIFAPDPKGAQQSVDDLKKLFVQR